MSETNLPPKEGATFQPGTCVQRTRVKGRYLISVEFWDRLYGVIQLRTDIAQHFVHPCRHLQDSKRTNYAISSLTKYTQISIGHEMVFRSDKFDMVESVISESHNNNPIILSQLLQTHFTHQLHSLRGHSTVT